jgi:hypothetical protein
MTPAVRYTLFQTMCKAYTTHIAFGDTVRSAMSSNDSSIHFIDYVLYGKSGFKTRVSSLSEESFIGSVHLKCKDMATGGNISILLFKNGKVKVSGGLSNVFQCHEEYISKLVSNLLTRLFGEGAWSHSICMLNCQTKVQLCPATFIQFIRRLQSSAEFFCVKEPTLRGRGRINVAKAYPFEESKSHLSIDPNGTIQLFGFKSFSDIDSAVTKLYLSHKEL